ncbi:MAG TPA: hypothetical protein VLX61_16365 [Anaerolineales bacterium]|nr:hypothetical protein [Anaerolineales bacterium]
MKRRALSTLVIVLFLSGCVLRTNRSPVTPEASTSLPVETATQVPPTPAPIPTSTATTLPTPDFSLIGLPNQSPGNSAFDFVSQMCNAQWFNRGRQVACPDADGQQDSGYVMSLTGETQGLPSNLSVLLTFPPAVHYGALFGKYPLFTVKAGDRFQALLACKAHTFCDVEFGFGYYDAGRRTDLKDWSYLFADPPILVDYPLDGIAGKTVQLGLSISANGNSQEADAVWVAPHIYRPMP